MSRVSSDAESKSAISFNGLKTRSSDPNDADVDEEDEDDDAAVDEDEDKDSDDVDNDNVEERSLVVLALSPRVWAPGETKTRLEASETPLSS